MAKGVIYVMSTAVAGLVKISKTGSKNYQERMRFLEQLGYYNNSSLYSNFFKSGSAT